MYAYNLYENLLRWLVSLIARQSNPPKKALLNQDMMEGKIKGRKRHISVDVLGIAGMHLYVYSAGISD